MCPLKMICEYYTYKISMSSYPFRGKHFATGKAPYAQLYVSL